MTHRAHRSSPTSGDLRDFDRAFDRAFVMVAFVVNRHLVDHMLRVGRELMVDDYEALLVWGVLAHQNIAHLLPPGGLPSAILDDRGLFAADTKGLRPLRLRDLVQITRLPRETVRRKLARLAEQRWIEHTPQGWVSSGARLEPTLREFTRETVRRFVATADELARVLRDADRAQDGRPRPMGGAAALLPSPAPGPAGSRGVRDGAGLRARRPRQAGNA
jgi:hypothetical protein